MISQDIVDGERGVAACLGEHGDITPAVAGVMLGYDALGREPQRCLLVGLGVVGETGQAYICRYVFDSLLGHVVIRRDAEAAAKTAEEAVVETHEVGGASVVGVVGRLVAAYCVRRREVFFGDTVAQQCAVAVAEAVDGLLLVADDEAVVALGDAVGDKRTQVVPLHVRRVLELVDQKVVERHAETLVDEGRVAAVDDFFEEVVGV